VLQDLFAEYRRSGVTLTTDAPLNIRLAVAGIGPTIAFRQSVRDDIDAGRLVPVLEDYCEPFPGFFLHFPRRRHRSAALRALIDYVGSELRGVGSALHCFPGVEAPCPQARTCGDPVHRRAPRATCHKLLRCLVSGSYGKRERSKTMRMFVAGGAGALGRRLIPRLVARGHVVTGTTHTPGKVDVLRRIGAEPVVVDGLDASAVGEAVARAEPDVIVHQMTALAGSPDMRHFDRWFATTNALRTVGTEHLVAAARAAGVRRLVAQSYTNWTNAPEGSAIKTEQDPFDPHPPWAQRQTLAAIRFLERAVLDAPLEGIVLRYGNFYGPGASESLVEMVHKRRVPMVGDGSGVWSWIHLDDAATATVAAAEKGGRGIYNIVDDDPAPVAEWLPLLAEAIGAPRPFRVPVWLGRIAAGEVIVSMMTRMRGASNAKAKRELGWKPMWPSWREGFREGLTDGSTRVSPPIERRAP
jgi:nucleoside-diphosphate-sugar epimerase